MSTRSTIAIKLNYYDIGRILPLILNGKETNYTVQCDETKPYLQIYCHHDGYIEYLGELLAKHTDYKEILSIILQGDTSFLYEKEEKLVSDVYAVREGFEDGDAPEVVDHPKMIRGTEYLYVFENGKWYVSDRYEINNEDLNEVINNKTLSSE